MRDRGAERITREAPKASLPTTRLPASLQKTPPLYNELFLRLSLSIDSIVRVKNSETQESYAGKLKAVDYIVKDTVKLIFAHDFTWILNADDGVQRVTQNQEIHTVFGDPRIFD